MNHMDLLTGYIDISTLTGVTSPDYRVFSTRNPSESFSRYYMYVFQLCYSRKIFYALGQGSSQLGRWRLPADQFNSFVVPVPSIGEQRAIASLLDRETEKLDALITKQERLIALLHEKRQAVISHAVTKGLDPKAPMKDSGVEWLGEVPAHWCTERIKWVAKLESGHTPDKKVDAYWTNCDIPWISLNDTGYLKENDFITDTAHQISALGIANSSARLLPPGIVVFSRDATIGRCAITTRPMAVSQHFIAWVCKELLVPEFLLRVLRSMTQELERLTFGATVKTIGMPDVKTLVTPLPPVNEQQAIVEHIRSETARIDKLIDATRRSVDLSREHRWALISAAVTGKIDVRDHAQHQEEVVTA